MHDKIIRLLSTATLDEALIKEAMKHCISIDAIPFIKIKKLVTQDAIKQIARLALKPAIVVFTSVNSVEAVVEMLPKKAIMPEWKIYCTGGATFTLLKKFWAYKSITFTAKNAKELAEKMIAGNLNEATFFCGNNRRDELPALLHQKRIKVNEIVVYETTETPVKLNAHYNGVLFFSPSAVTSFFSVNEIDKEATLFAIGETTTESIQQFCSNAIVVSDFPAKEKLVAKAITFYKN